MSERSLALFNPTTVAIPSESEWRTMAQMAAQLIPTGFLPSSIKSEAQAVAVMLKGRELAIPPMYALSNIAIINGKPVVSAETMLALIHRDHGHKAIRVKDSSDKACTVQYRTPGWDDVSDYTFTIEDAATAGLTGKNPVWKSYPAAMLRARCISAVARMAFPECIAGMYVPGELGDAVQINESGEIEHVDEDGVIETTVTVDPTPIQPEVDAATKSAREGAWRISEGYGFTPTAHVHFFKHITGGVHPRQSTKEQAMAVSEALGNLTEQQITDIADGARSVADVMGEVA